MVYTVWNMIELYQFVIFIMMYQVNGQCQITNAAIFVNSGDRELDDENIPQLLIEGITTGSQATSVTWRRNGEIVDRNTAPSGSGLFFDGGGQTILGFGPCENQIYRVALLVGGYLPGNYTYTVNNSDTPISVTSPVLQLQDPDPPTNLVLKQIGNNRVQATWIPPASSPEATYRVYLNSSSDHGIPVTGTTYTTDPFPSNSSVTIHVRATTGSYLSTSSASSTLTVRAPTGSPGPPTATAVTSTSITITWGEIICGIRHGLITSYTIQYGEGIIRNKTINTQSNATTHLFTGLKPFTHYTFTVAGVNSFGRGPFSISGGVIKTNEDTPTGSPGIPNASRIRSTSITLTWTEIDASDRNGLIKHYIIQYGEGTTRDRTIRTLSSFTRYLITGLKPFTQYTFTVAGVNSVNSGPFSNATSVITTSQERPSVVRNIKQTVTPYTVLLLWDTPEPLNGILVNYTVQYKINRTRQLPRSTPNTVFLITNLTPNTLVSDITISATTGGGEGPSVRVPDVTTSISSVWVPDVATSISSVWVPDVTTSISLTQGGSIPHVSQTLDYHIAIAVVVTLLATVTLYSLILLITALSIYSCKKKSKSTKKSIADVDMTECVAYGQVVKEESASLEYEAITQLYQT